MTEKKKNPLFVVSSDGQDVEEVGGPWEFIMSKLGLRPYFAFLEQFFEYLVSQVDSFGSLELLKSWVDALVESLEKVVEKSEKVLKPLLPSLFS